MINNNEFVNNKKYILTIDQGTTSTRSILFDKKANMIAVSQIEITQITPFDGYVEHNALEIFVKVKQTIANVLKQAHISASDIASIAITNQRETTVLWDKTTNMPVYNAIVWQSRQSQYICDKLIKEGKEKLIQDKTGLVINSYFSASKIKWIFDNVKGVYEKALKGEILFGTIDTYLLYMLTNGNSHLTDYTNASRTMLYNIYDLCYDDELLKLFDVPLSILPKVVDSNFNFGNAVGLSDIDPLFKEVSINAMIGDQQASLFGHCCFEQGDVKNTYGTGCFMLMNTKKPIHNPKYGLLETIAYSIDGRIDYCLEGSVFIAGAGLMWLRDNLEMIDNPKQSEKSCKGDNPSGNVYVVPALVGLGTPYWDSSVRGSILGLCKNTTKDNIVCATLESIAYQSKDVLDVMKSQSHVEISRIGVDGGVSNNDYLMQFQSDILNIQIDRPICKETTALGATYIAGLSVKFFKDIEEIKSLHLIDSVFLPNMNEELRRNKLEGWNKAIKSTLSYK